MELNETEWMIIECNSNQVAFYSIFISFLTEKRVDPVAATYFNLVLAISLKPGNRVETLIHYML